MKPATITRTSHVMQHMRTLGLSRWHLFLLLRMLVLAYVLLNFLSIPSVLKSLLILALASVSLFGTYVLEEGFSNKPKRMTLRSH